MAKKSNAIIVIPAHNEEETIGKVLKACMAAKKQGVVREVLVVNDGSTDSTAKIAKEAGATVSYLKTNQGKGAAFFKGLKHCRKLKAETMVMVDADLFNFKVEHVKEMLERVSRKGIKMSVMMVKEGDRKQLTGMYSGERAIKLDFLEFLFLKGNREKLTLSAKRFMEVAGGFGLETALHVRVKKQQCDIFVPKTTLRARKATARSLAVQHADLLRARLLIWKRLSKAKELREQRVKRTKSVGRRKK